MVGTVKAVPLQDVDHAPMCRDPEDPQDPNNPAHTNVLGPKKDPDGKVKIRALYVDACRIHGWAINPPTD